MKSADAHTPQSPRGESSLLIEWRSTQSLGIEVYLNTPSVSLCYTCELDLHFHPYLCLNVHTLTHTPAYEQALSGIPGASETHVQPDLKCYLNTHLKQAIFLFLDGHTKFIHDVSVCICKYELVADQVPHLRCVWRRLCDAGA